MARHVSLYSSDVSLDVQMLHVGVICPLSYLTVVSHHEGGKYCCNKCDYSANYSADLIKHKKMKHEGLIYDCGQCNHSTDRLYSLSQQKKTKHKYICD